MKCLNQKHDVPFDIKFLNENNSQILILSKNIWLSVQDQFSKNPRIYLKFQTNEVGA